MGNIFDKRGIVPPSFERERGREVFETLLSASSPNGVRLERIMSFAAEDGMWYDQECDEWVMVMRGEAVLEWDSEGGAVTALEAGDYLLIGAHRRHRVLRTSYDCVWLALHLGVSDISDVSGDLSASEYGG